MKKTAIIIRDKEQNLEVKKLMDKGGLVWNSGDSLFEWGGDIAFGDFYILVHNYLRNGKITHNREYKDVYSALCFAKEKGLTIITADEFLACPNLLENWKKPEPEPEPEIKSCQYCGKELVT